MRYLFIKLFTLFASLFVISVQADSPNTFKRLGSIYEQDLIVLEQLKRHPYFKTYLPVLKSYEKEVNDTFATGYQLDYAIENESSGVKLLSKDYLKALRRLEKDQQEIERLYAQALTYAMQNSDFNLFELLLQNSMEPIENRHIRKRLQRYYKKQRSIKKIAVAEKLLTEMELEAQNRKVAMQEMEAYEENLRVVAAEEAARIRKMTAEKRTRNVIVSTRKLANGYAFVADNLNTYRVTITLDFEELVNFSASTSLPVSVELPAQGSQEILHVTHSDPKKRANFSSSFSWVMGSASAEHNDEVSYRLPFAAGSSVVVSQGFNGTTTHNGFSRYAVDFQVPIGTPIYAARAGTVVSAESKHNKGGFSKSYGKYANYIVIEHDDLTLGKYYHLKKDGVSVKVGQKVNRGELIGQSGNTGYSSGPHLHFSVSKVDPDSKKRPLTVPFRFKTKKRIVKSPKRGDKYVVDL
ncbi:MAG: peptidoglycan DD-metalloendopeptidase family protein [Campylobacterota bacterium]|nr:peptidoglycan DD-metalloendopeptidase family protein [Campylobacterota bacterium]